MVARSTYEELFEYLFNNNHGGSLDQLSGE